MAPLLPSELYTLSSMALSKAKKEQQDSNPGSVTAFSPAENSMQQRLLQGVTAFAPAEAKKIDMYSKVF
jgi:hypothetical protein